MKYSCINNSFKFYVTLPAWRNFYSFFESPKCYSSVSAAASLGELDKEWVGEIIRKAVSGVNESFGEREAVEEKWEYPKCTADIFKRWGCTENEISDIFRRRPSLLKANVEQIQLKLNVLSNLGLKASDLVRMINCRPRLLSSRFTQSLDERLEFLLALFGTRETLRKAIVRNPSLLTYDLQNMIKPVVALYEDMGVQKNDLITMLLSRPTLIPRSRLDDEKKEYIRKTGVSSHSKMYKYVVTLMAISRAETIREKLANFEKFGFTEEEVLAIYGRTPLLLTLSVDKVQRNMTFILGTLKFPATVVVKYPFLLLCNLETVLKPRVVLAGKIQEMSLEPQIKGPSLLRALRMKEKRFLKAFVNCHPGDVANELLEYYKNAKEVKRLAVTSRRSLYRGFPF